MIEFMQGDLDAALDDRDSGDGNFRFTVATCACNPSWYYEDWLILIANGEVKTDGFVSREPDQHVDHRVHLYGGSRLPGRRHGK